NAIEIYIRNKPLCSSWNGGAAIEGIQNANGTVAYVVPGRNYPSQWTATNDAYRFTPNGLPSYSIDWFRGSTLVGSGDVINVCHSSAADYVAIATYYSCFLSAIVVKDTVHIVPGGASFDVTGIQSGDVSCAGGNNGYAQAL